MNARWTAISLVTQRMVLGALVGSALLMVLERALLSGPALLQMAWFTRWAALTGAIGAAWLGYALGAVGALELTRLVLVPGLPIRPWWRRVVVGALVSLAVVIAAILAAYTFSGREARLLWYRPLALIGLTAAMTAALMLPFASVSYARPGMYRRIAGVLLLAGTSLGLLLNRLVLPEEYEPLHVFLSVLALLYASGAGAMLAQRVRGSRRRWVGPAALLAALLMVLGSSQTLAGSHLLSFLVQGQTAGLRYLNVGVDGSFDGVTAPDVRVALKPDLAAEPVVARTAREGRAQAPAPHLIVVSIDNVQPDHMGTYGYRKHPTTPNIDALAESGMVFERAYSCFPRTRMFSTSMLLGRLVPPFKDHDAPAAYRELALTNLLKRRNYHVLLKGWFDVRDRFTPKGYGVDTWIPPASEHPSRRRRGFRHVPMRENYRTFRRHLRTAKKRDRPVFAWMHFLRPHQHGTEFLTGDHGFGPDRSDDYDSAIAVADSYLPKLRALVDEELGESHPTYWVIVSDHGAGFRNEDGAVSFRESGRDIAEEFIHVPLIVSGHDIASGRSRLLVSAAIDLPATLLDLAGIQAPASYDGVSLVPVLYGWSSDAREAARGIYVRYYGWRGVLYGNYKFITQRGVGALYDVIEDPNQRMNLADEQPNLVKMLDDVVQHEYRRIEKGYRQSSK